MDEHELPADTVVIEPPPAHPTDASGVVIEWAEQLEQYGLRPEDFPDKEEA